MDDFLREIQEDIAREKWASIWARYGKFLTIAVAAVVLAAGFWQVKEHMAHEENMVQTDHLLAAIKTPDAAAFEAVAAQTDGVQQGFAKLVEAQILENTGDSQAASAKLAELAAKKDDSLPYDLARSLSAGADKTSDTFTFTALERAGWQAVEASDFASATKAFEAILQGEEVPPSIMDRANAGLAYVAAQSGKE